MTIQEMFEREDIYSIIENTLPEYFSVVHSKNIEVSVSNKKVFQRLRIYPRLGVIVPSHPSSELKREVYAWFDVQGNLLKKVIAKLYIALCFCSFGIFSDGSLQLSDYSVVDNNTLIIPSNRKIRIYQFDKKWVDSIVKSGFRDDYFKNEVTMREKLDYPFVVGILKKGQRWYREEYLRGRGLVRIPRKQYDAYLNKALEDIKQIYNDTVQQIKICEYVDELVCKLQDKFRIVIENKRISCGDRIMSIIAMCKKKAEMSNDLMPVVLAHGDLQTGNIHIDQDNKLVYIIDWETAGLKSIWYDAATVLCSTRRRDRFAEMINKADSPIIKNKILFFDDNKERDMTTVVAVLLLEELFFYLEEMADFPGNIGAEVIDRFLHELDEIDLSIIKR